MVTVVLPTFVAASSTTFRLCADDQCEDPTYVDTKESRIVFYTQKKLNVDGVNVHLTSTGAVTIDASLNIKPVGKSLGCGIRIHDITLRYEDTSGTLTAIGS